MIVWSQERYPAEGKKETRVRVEGGKVERDEGC